MPFYAFPPEPSAGGLPVMNPRAAGIDIGDREIFVAVPPDCAPVDKVVRNFASFTGDLHALADWLAECGVTTVALESTGVYWIPLFEILEDRKFKVCLVDTRRVRSVPGRKSDVRDCQWLQKLHSHGLLSSAFRPAPEIVVLRSFNRQRQMCTECAAEHVQHMQKALQLMNLKLSTVINDVTGTTGMSILRAILSGERDPAKLAKLRDPRCHADEVTIAKALRGNYRDDHLFALRQAVDLFEVYQKKIAECDVEIERQLARLPDQSGGESPSTKKGSKAYRARKNAPRFDARNLLFRAFGVDLLQISGVEAGTALKILSEVGTDMSRWASAGQFASWLGLSPRNDVSGGRVLRRGVAHGANRAAQALRMAAQALGRTKTALGAFYRRMQRKGGGRHAVTATAHKLARIIYSLLTRGQEYVDIGEAEYTRQYEERLLASLKRAADKLGYNLTPHNDLPPELA